MTSPLLRLPLARPAAVALCCAILLTGCGSSSKNAGVRSANPGVAAPTPVDELPALPQLGDPAYVAMLDKVNIEYRRWLANPDAYLAVPTQAAPWPCAVPAEERDKLAGVPNPNDPKVLAIYAKQERAAGMKKGMLKPPGVESPEIHVLKGTCVKGKLQGDLELLATYTSVIKGLDDETRIPQRVFKRYTMQAGKPVGQVFSVTTQGAHRHTKPQTITVRTLSAVFGVNDVAASPTLPTRAVSISYMRTETPKPAFGTWVSTTQHVFQTVPLKGDRWRQVSYYGPTKISDVNFKGERMHGRSSQYAYELKSPFSKDPVRVAASEFCYDDGEQIKSAACDVD